MFLAHFTKPAFNILKKSTQEILLKNLLNYNKPTLQSLYTPTLYNFSTNFTNHNSTESKTKEYIKYIKNNRFGVLSRQMTIPLTKKPINFEIHIPSTKNFSKLYNKAVIPVKKYFINDIEESFNKKNNQSIHTSLEIIKKKLHNIKTPIQTYTLAKKIITIQNDILKSSLSDNEKILLCEEIIKIQSQIGLQNYKKNHTYYLIRINLALYLIGFILWYKNNKNIRRHKYFKELISSDITQEDISIMRNTINTKIKKHNFNIMPTERSNSSFDQAIYHESIHMLISLLNEHSSLYNKSTSGLINLFHNNKIEIYKDSDLAKADGRAYVKNVPIIHNNKKINQALILVSAMINTHIEYGTHDYYTYPSSFGERMGNDIDYFYFTCNELSQEYKKNTKDVYSIIIEEYVNFIKQHEKSFKNYHDLIINAIKEIEPEKNLKLREQDINIKDFHFNISFKNDLEKGRLMEIAFHNTFIKLVPNDLKTDYPQLIKNIKNRLIKK
jgi:hypothetical protein